MKTRNCFAVALALVLGALPVFAGVCDLRCASAQGAMRRFGVQERATESTTGSGLDAMSCPLHAADKSDPEPFPSSSSPCHGQRGGGGGAVLVAASASPSSMSSGHSPAFEASSVPGLVRAGANSSRSCESEFHRRLGFSPLLSILRL